MSNIRFPNYSEEKTFQNQARLLSDYFHSVEQIIKALVWIRGYITDIIRERGTRWEGVKHNPRVDRNKCFFISTALDGNNWLQCKNKNGGLPLIR